MRKLRKMVVAEGWERCGEVDEVMSSPWLCFAGYSSIASSFQGAIVFLRSGLRIVLGKVRESDRFEGKGQLSIVRRGSVRHGRRVGSPWSRERTGVGDHRHR